MLKKILLGAAVVVVALVLVVAKQPSEFNVSKSLAMDAPAATIFPYINDFHAWEKWSPWEKLDPNSTKTYEGAQSGVGAIKKWSGNSEVGEGSMKITESVLNNSVKIELAMVKPYSADNVIEFSLQAVNEKQTIVTWTMVGKKGFAAKLMGLFHNCNEVAGEKFEQGLANLRVVAQGGTLEVEAKEEVKTEEVKEEVKTEEVKK